MFADWFKGGQGTGTWYLWYLEKRVCGFIEGRHEEIICCNLTEHGIATLGYKANSAGVGGGHGFARITIDGWDAVIVPGLLQHESECAIDTLFVIPLYIICSLIWFVYPDERFPPRDIYLL